VATDGQIKHLTAETAADSSVMTDYLQMEICLGVEEAAHKLLEALHQPGCR
jgi:hypothetical protein